MSRHRSHRKTPRVRSPSPSSSESSSSPEPVKKPSPSKRKRHTRGRARSSTNSESSTAKTSPRKPQSLEKESPITFQHCHATTSISALENALVENDGDVYISDYVVFAKNKRPLKKTRMTGPQTLETTKTSKNSSVTESQLPDVDDDSLKTPEAIPGTSSSMDSTGWCQYNPCKCGSICRLKHVQGQLLVCYDYPCLDGRCRAFHTRNQCVMCPNNPCTERYCRQGHHTRTQRQTNGDDRSGGWRGRGRGRGRGGRGRGRGDGGGRGDDDDEYRARHSRAEFTPLS